MVPLIVLLAGCAVSKDGGVADHPDVSVAWPSGTVLDPKLDGAEPLPVTWDVAALAGADCTMDVSAVDPVGRIATLGQGDPSGESELTGFDDDGLPFDPGPLRVTATLSCEDGARVSATTYAWIVRLGVVAVDFVGHPDDESGGPIGLAFHKTDLVTREVTVLPEDLPEYVGHAEADLSDLDHDDGTPRASVAPWTDPDVPPWGDGEPGDVAHNLPAAYVAGSPMRVWVTPGSMAVSSGATWPALPSAEWEELSPPALSLVSDAGAAEGSGIEGATPIAFDVGELPGSISKQTVTLTWHWQADGPDGLVDIPGSQTTTHTVYGLAGRPALLDGTAEGLAPDVPWIGVIDDLMAPLDGVGPDDAAVLDALRDHLNDDPWVLYNPGDSAYTSYDGSYVGWDAITADLSGWMDRTDGIDLWCHSMSCLLSTLAGNVGVDAPQQVLGVSFTTNYVNPAGTDTWARYGFTLHSVVSPDDGAHIWDAAIDLDGDGDPGSQPTTALEPKGLSFEDYRSALTADAIDIILSDRCYVR